MPEDPLGMPFHTSRHPGPNEPSHWMYLAYASNRQIHSVILYTAAVLAIVLFVGMSTFPDVIVSPAAVDGAQPDSAALAKWQTDLLVLIACAGALGGVVHLLTSLGGFIGGRQLLRSWLIFYYFGPPVGAILALVVYFILRMGVLSPISPPEVFNVYGILGFAVLTGLFARQATEKLAEVFDTLFQKAHDEIQSRDSSELFSATARTQDDFAQRLPDTLPPAVDTFGEEKVDS